MRILLVTSHFFPEDFKANDMAFELARRGHDVTVLCPIPDYPHGRFYDGYGVFSRRKETVAGVKIIRTLVTPRRDGSPKWLALNYITHTLFSTLRGLLLGITSRFDIVLVHETSPVMIGIPAVLVKKMQGIPLCFWVLDLWPESLVAAGGIRNKKILSAFASLTRWLYAGSDRILMGSRGFHKSINRLGDFNHKLEFFPNWVDESVRKPSDMETPGLPEGFNVMFAGNIGEAQDMPHLLDAAERLSGKGVNFILVGDGRKKEYVEEYVSAHGLSNVYLPGRFPIEAMPSLFAKADLLFLSLKKSPAFALTVPAKLQAYMAAGKPVLAMLDGEGCEVIRDAGCGWFVPAEDSAALADRILEIKSLPPDELRRRGENGKDYSNRYYNLETCIDHLEEIMGSCTE